MNGAFIQRRSRIGMLTLVLAGLFLLAAIRLVVLVVLDGPRLNSLARSEHTEETELSAVRGPIVDRTGVAFALSAETRSVYARPRLVLDNTEAEQRAKLAEVLRIRSSDLAAHLSRPAPFIWLARRLSREQADAAEALGVEGVGAISEYKRFYPESNLAAAVVGLAGMDGQGLSGLELEYDRIIRGEPMKVRIDRDALGHPILDSPLALSNPRSGAQLELTIDSEIQSLAELRLADEVRESGAKRGSAIVLDPFTGEVLAMAAANAEGADVHDRLHNPALQDAFEPGSTAKGILGAIALDDHAITVHQRVFCENGQVTIGGRPIHDHSPHGWLDLGGIIQVSSNIGAAKIALLLGSQRYRDGLAAFGLGRPTGIDLPGESGGLLRSASKWTPIDLANHGFGQGIAVTPIQLAVAYAAIANGGLVMRPYVVRAAYDSEGNRILEHSAQVLSRAVSPSAAHTMNLLLRAVVEGEGGTGSRAAVDDFIVAGKTGTAQMVNPATGTYYQSRLVASFVGFVPADNPRLVILVVLEDVDHGHFGGLYAAPVFSEIASGALGRLNVASSSRRLVETAGIIPFAMGSETGYAPVPALPALAPEPARVPSLAPDFSRLSIRDALSLARSTGVDIEADGSGYVTSQEPMAGERLARGGVKLELSTDADPSLAPEVVKAASIAKAHPSRTARR
jgi:cell division protein FtsI (penicillin-binding protein 3)